MEKKNVTLVHTCYQSKTNCRGRRLRDAIDPIRNASPLAARSQRVKSTKPNKSTTNSIDNKNLKKKTKKNATKAVPILLFSHAALFLVAGTRLNCTANR